MSGIIKEILSDDLAKSELIEGVNIVEKIVGSSMGLRGRTVLIESQGGKAEPTKDGYNILQAITLDNPTQNLAVELIKEASQKTVDFCGDGTTATVVLAHAFITNSDKALKEGKSPIDIVSDIEKSRDKVLAYLDEISEPITDKLIYDVAKTSANGDEKIAKIVSEAFISAGENGSVAHFRSNTDETFLDQIEGTLVESGYDDELFVNVLSDRTVLFENNPLVLVSHINFKTVNQIFPFMEYAATNNRELVIVSDMEFQVKDVLIKNKLSGKLKSVVISPPSYGHKRKDFLSDLAMICGTNMISTLSGEVFDGRVGEFLGTSKKVLVGKSDSIFLPGENTNHKDIEGKIEELKEVISKSTNPLEKKYLKERIAKLSGKVSIIKVGAITESELKEKIDRVDDAVGAVRSAKEEGVVAGGGVALYNAFLDLGTDTVTSKSLQSTMIKILSNAGIDLNKDKLFKGSMKYPIGYDVKEFKEVNMFEVGIVDATKVVKNALINAISVANTITMTNNIIFNKRERNE